MNLRRAKAMARNEFLHVLRDSRSLTMALALPVLLLVLFGFALSLDVDKIPVYVVDLDRTPQSRDFIAQFEASRYFQVDGYRTSVPEISRLIDEGRCVVGLVLLGGFGEDVDRGRRASLQLIIDGSDSNTATIAVGYARTLILTYSANVMAEIVESRTGLRLHPAVQAKPRIWYNETLESKNFIVPGLIAVILMVIASLLTSLTIAREWETGTMEQLLSTPIRPAELVLGKMAAYFTVGLVDSIIAIAAGIFVFQVPFRGSLLLLASSTLVFLCGAMGWGILLSALTRNQLLAFLTGVFSSFLPGFLLSGFVFSIENMPPVIQVLTHLVPARYYITILQGTFLKGLGFEVLAGQLFFLFVYASLVFLVTTRLVGGKMA